LLESANANPPKNPGRLYFALDTDRSNAQPHCLPRKARLLPESAYGDTGSSEGCLDGQKPLGPAHGDPGHQPAPAAFGERPYRTLAGSATIDPQCRTPGFDPSGSRRGLRPKDRGAHAGTFSGGP